MLRLILVAASVLAAWAASAQEDEERYRLERTQDGYVRMDTQTGAMSICTEDAGELVCRPASDRTVADGGELADLRKQVEALEKRVADLEAAKPVDVLPTEQEFEQTMDYAERFMRRFMDVFRELEKDAPAEGVPDRT